MKQLERGATLVEFVIVGPIFLLLLLVIFDLLRLTYNYVTVQYVASRVMRAAVVGPTARPAEYDTQGEWIRGDVIRLGSSLGLHLEAKDIRICSFTTLIASTPCYDDANCVDLCSAGEADRTGEIIAVQVQIPARQGFVWTASNILGHMNYAIRPALVVARNERWANLPDSE